MNEDEKRCECDLCQYSRKVREIINRRDIDELISLIEELMSWKYNLGADVNYYECILNGSWGSAVEILERALEKAKNHPNRLEMSLTEHGKLERVSEKRVAQ